MLSHSILGSLDISDLEVLLLREKKRKEKGGRLSILLTTRIIGTLRSLNTFTAWQNVLSALPVDSSAYSSSVFCEVQMLHWSLVNLADEKKQTCNGWNLVMNCNNAWSGKVDACYLLVIVLCPFFFFRVEWEEKDFLGRLGQRESRWIKANSFTILLLFLKVYKASEFVIAALHLTVNLCLQGEPGITGKVGPMGERVRNPDIATSCIE